MAAPCQPKESKAFIKAKEVIPDRNLAELALQILEWESLAPHLDLTKQDVVGIKKDNKDFYKEQKLSCLQTWKEHYTNNASYRCLMQAALSAQEGPLVSCLLKLPGIGEELQALVPKYQRWPSTSSGYSSLKGEPQMIVTRLSL